MTLMSTAIRARSCTRERTHATHGSEHTGVRLLGISVPTLALPRCSARSLQGSEFLRLAAPQFHHMPGLHNLYQTEGFYVLPNVLTPRQVRVWNRLISGYVNRGGELLTEKALDNKGGWYIGDFGSDPGVRTAGQ